MTATTEGVSLADRIAEAIWTGEFRPGEWLRQVDLQSKFDATRFDVRSALNELSVRKTIERVPNRGYRVLDPDRQTLRHIRNLRVILETAAAREACRRMDAGTVEALRGIAGRFTHAVDHGSRIDQSRINREFHQVMFHACGNPVLEETIWLTRDRARGSALTSWRSHADLRRSARQHEEMVAALQARDEEGLVDLVHRHIAGVDELAEADESNPATW